MSKPLDYATATDEQLNAAAARMARTGDAEYRPVTSGWCLLHFIERLLKRGWFITLAQRNVVGEKILPGEGEFHTVHWSWTVAGTAWVTSWTVPPQPTFARAVVVAALQLQRAVRRAGRAVKSKPSAVKYWPGPHHNGNGREFT